MSNDSYERVDWDGLSAEHEPVQAAPEPTVRMGIVPLSIALCVAQAVVTIVAQQQSGAQTHLTSTLISITAFGVLFLLLLAANPLLTALYRLIGHRLVRLGRWFWPGLWTLGVIVGVVGLWITSSWWYPAAGLLIVVGGVLLCARRLNHKELICIFVAMLVTSGISTYGLTAQLVPMIATPWNPEWNTPQRGWDNGLLPAMNPKLYLSVPADATLDEREAFKADFRDFRQGVEVEEPADGAGPGAWWGYYRQVYERIPWDRWLGPLGYWMVFVGACYAMFYCLTYIVLGSWSKRDKLIFPLARLPQSLLPTPTHGSPRLPTIFRQFAFWVAFAVSFLYVSYNAAASADLGLFAHLEPILNGIWGKNVDQVLHGSILEGLGGDFNFHFMVIFTVVGIAFLLPVATSFSIWFYFLVGKLIILGLVWLGYGQNTSDFPSNWLWENNPVSAQGGGALLFFSGLCLVRCLRDFVHSARGKSLHQKLKLSIPVVGFVISVAVLAAWLKWNHIPLLWALLIVGFLCLLTIGLMRIVAEGGIYWFQSHFSFFHLFKVLGLGKVLSPVLLGPLMAIYWVLFLDLKTFLAPNLLNGVKMQQDAGPRGRATFHVNLLACIVVTLIVSLGFMIFFSYMKGAQQMHVWFNTWGPQAVMDEALAASQTPPDFDAGTFSWYSFGAVWTALSIFLRRSLFWWPHPIGYIMLINPLMSSMWLSFLLGWMFKKSAIRYGGKETFDRVRTLFIGLIIGELIAIFVWTAASLLSDVLPFVPLFKPDGIDLNLQG